MYTAPVQLIMWQCLGSRFQTAPLPHRGNSIQHCFKAGFLSHWKFFFLQAFKGIKQANPLGNVVFANIASGHLCLESGMSCSPPSTVPIHRSHQPFRSSLMAALLDTSMRQFTLLKIIPQAEELGQGWEQGWDALCIKVSYRCSPKHGDVPLSVWEASELCP